eukprot:TRINITY_DN4837_c0_g1_i1.p2 TRINITY_DN4837_c0_g1~~TRINITY_DN4837_c0_g1_i1.p2  ORF type:complete len:155 (+),score=33.13 TRINITY_DN4837_c0_g1_i1:757-1221(+)
MLIQKIKQKLNERNQKSSEEISQLMKDTSTLNEAVEMLNKEKENLLRRRENIEQTITNLNLQIDEISSWVAEHQQTTEEVDLDKMSEPKDVIQLQKLELIAEIQSVEDLQYCLDTALRKSLIDLPTYLKQTRLLSSRLFMRKALLLKICKISDV